MNFPDAITAQLRRALRLELIEHDVPDADRDWFARCKMRYFETFPWVSADICRTLVFLWLFAKGPAELLFAILLLGIAALVGGLFVQRNSLQIAPDTFDRLNLVRAFLLVRGAVWATAISAAVLYAPKGNASLPIYFGAGTLMLDVLFMTAMPKVGVISCAFTTLAMSSALVITGAMSPTAAFAVTAMLMLGTHFTIFHLYHMFATRRLRTRRLQAASETIEVLLGHYDEHGSDWLVEIDRSGCLVNPSNRMCKALGRTRSAVEGIHIQTLIERGPELAKLMSLASRNEKIRNLLLPAKVSGERRWWSISGCPIFDSKGDYAGYRAFVQDVTEKHQAEERVRTLALTDTLTGLANRAVFTARLQAALEGAKRDTVLGVLFVDLDFFKITNDTMGHAAGDEVLRESAKRIATLIRPGDIAARFGGDEFALLLTSVTSADEVGERAQALADALARPIHIEGKTIASGASIGVAIGPYDGADGESLLRAADLALYEAKARGRGRSVAYQPVLLEERAERRKLEGDLRQALDRGEFAVHYQPLIDIGSREIAGYEALLRWNHPIRGSVPPSEFIAIAEELDIINPIGEWVLREALAEAATWRDDITIAVNVSPTQMRGETLLGQVVGALAASGVAPERLELEITENLLLHDCEVHTRIMHRLRAFGVRIALDDFGTGYSSLNYLRSFPFDKLKIDRSFVRDIGSEKDSLSIIDMLLRLGREFSMETIAEGVESERQFAALQAMGCDQVQGFLFGRPIPAALIPTSVRARARDVPKPVHPVEWLNQRRVADFPADLTFCRTACRKC